MLPCGHVLGQLKASSYTTITVVFPVTVLWVIVEGEHFSELG